MKINRSLVKEQAKMIIKGKVFSIFIVAFVVMLICNMSASVYFVDFGSSGLELFRENNNEGNYSDYSSDYYGHDYDNPIESFEGTSVDTTASTSSLSSVGSSSSIAANIITLVFAPLYVTMAGMYLALIRRSPSEDFALGRELGGIFKKTFNETYFKKFILELLVGVINTLLLFLLIFPGIIFRYSAYFTREIMSDNPDLKPSEVIKLSKKMISGSRTELFVLDLSFIPWFLLCAVTCGIALIYVVPYYNTVKALYYENFRMRAISHGKITADDFLSFDEKMNKYAQNAQQPGGYNNPPYGSEPFGNPPYGAPSEPQDYYYTPPTANGSEPQQDTADTQNAPQSDYYAPTQPNTATEPHTPDPAPDQNNGYPYTDMPQSDPAPESDPATDINE